MEHGISVVCLVYNEEKRIERFINSFYEYDEIIIIDKSSTDRTVEIASKMGVKVISVPYTDKSSIWKIGVDAAKFQWVFILTASDVVHPKYTEYLYSLINDDEFNENYDQIKYAISMHVLGICDKHSVFDSRYRVGLCKKECLKISDRVHEELSFLTDKTFVSPFDRNISVHHLSHETIDTYYDRQLRYSKQEVLKNRPLKRCFLDIFKEIYFGIRKSCWKIGWKGIGLTLMMVNYRILILLRYIEKKIGDVPQLYNDFSESITSDKKVFHNPEYEKYFTKK